MGVKGLDDYGLVRKIQLTNVIAAFSFVLSLVFNIGFFLGGSTFITASYLFIIAVLFALTIFFNHLKFHLFSRNWMLFIMAVSIMSGPFFNGINLPVEIVFLPSIGTPFLLFGQKQLSLSITWSAIFLTLYFLTQHFYEVVTPLEPVSREHGIIMYNFLIIVLFLWTSAIFISLSNENKSREELIENALEKEKELRKSLEASYSKLVKSQDDLINKEKQRIKAQESEHHALKKTAFKADFLARISNKLKEPLKGLSESLELLTSQSKFDYVNDGDYYKVLSSSQTLSKIVSDVLDLGKIEEGELELNPKKMPLKGFVEKSIAIFKQDIEKRNTKIDLTYQNDLPEWIQADEFRVSQVINTLLTNAYNAYEKPCFKIVLTACGSQKIKVLIKSSGSDLSQDNEWLDFSDYTQSLSSIEEESDMNLKISKHLVKLMGGEIGLEFGNGIETNFWFTFNCEISSESTIAENVNSKNHLNLSLSVLLVDDMEINRSLTRAMLEKYNCSVQEAESGIKAVELYEDDVFDLVLMDINMPGISGDEAVRRIKRNYKKANSCFVGLSANVLEDEKDKYIELGLDDYLAKPITFEKLSQGLKKWFDFNKANDYYINTNSFLINEEKINTNAELLGGSEKFISYIDKFLNHNQKIWEELNFSFKENEIEQLKENFHKLSGIAVSIGASGYYEILNVAYSIAQSGGQISEEEFLVLINSSKEVEKGMNQIKVKWQQSEY